MSKVKVIEVHENVFSNNEKQAEKLRYTLKEKGVFMINVMSSPGSGKTTTLTSLINNLKNELKIALMNVDIKSSVDADTIASKTGIRSLQINNGGLCHIDADMVNRSIEQFNIDDIDLLILENIGNLVCPAEFDTGAHKNIMILSVPEGDDKPLKYPLMFSVCDLILINKIDTLEYFDFDLDLATKRIKDLNPIAKIIPISAITGEGINELSTWIKEQIKLLKK